jgi:hypothetical protein
MVEKVKIDKSKKRKKPKRLSKEDALWRAILKRDLQQSELALYQQTVDSEMLHQAFELEKRRSQKDYVR